MELEQGTSIGLGVSVDSDGEAVVLVMVGTEGGQFAIPMSPEVAISFGRMAREMAREAQTLQDEIEDLDPEEIVDRLQAIQNRYAAPSN